MVAQNKGPVIVTAGEFYEAFFFVCDIIFLSKALIFSRINRGSKRFSSVDSFDPTGCWDLSRCYGDHRRLRFSGGSNIW